MKKLYLFLLLMTLSSPILLAQIYVTETGAGNKDGTSWVNAFDGTQLQTAINSATAGQQVWVAKGIYKPTESLSSTGMLTDGLTPVTTRDNSFILKTAVEIYGGFAGGETSINGRIDINTTNETILSGDLNNSNTADDGDSYHVVSSRNASLGAILNGFTIQHGFANGTSSITEGAEEISQNNGAGINIRGANTAMSFANLVIKNNESTTFSAGVQLRGSGANKQYYFDKVTFQNNKGGGSGGALYIYYTSSTTKVNITDCIFESNTGAGTSGGGAIITVNSAGTINISGTKFIGNKHDYYGGALRLGTGTANIIGCEFKQNSSERGAVYTTATATTNIENCKFDNNDATGSGGQVYIYSGTLNIRKAVFTNGKAVVNGGAIYIASSSESATSSTVHISNTMFYNNVAVLGGAIYQTYGTYQTNANASSLTSVNNTFYSNKCTSGSTLNESGGAIYFVSNAAVTLNVYNNIFNGNLYGYDAVNNTGGTSSDFRRGQTSTNQNYFYNLIQSTAPSTMGSRYVGSNIVNAGPTLLFASTAVGDNNFLWPVQGGIGVNAGNEKDKDNVNLYTDISTTTDLLGNPRVNGIIDLGAIEWSTVLPVTISSFNASIANNRTQLKWNVGTEQNVNRYEVERSQDGTDFTKVGEVLTSGSSLYTMVDANPQLGVNYYRLKTVDNDGSYSYYGTIQSVKVNTLITEEIGVYPNPVKEGKINISLIGYPTGTYTYKLISASGIMVQQGELNYNGAFGSVNLAPSLGAGAYILNLSLGNKIVQAKFIKQ